MKKSLISILLCSLGLSGFAEKTPQQVNQPDSKWWKEAVVYQIYPRSFKDTNGDGVGDLKGIISQLDYIKSLGVDVIWLNPIFESPNADNGYDISNYRGIMKEFGTMEDFDVMLKGMHDRGLKLLLDLVVNHSSDEHKWFQESRKSRTNPYRNYYHWWPAEKGKPAFRPGAFEADGSGWRYDSLTNAYYLHYFNYKQPDLNWENPKVRAEVFDMMKFWLDKGIDGFRMDVIPFISKDTLFPVITQQYLDKNYNGDWSQYMGNGPFVHQYLKEMNAQVLSKYNCMSVAEGAGVTSETAHNFVDADRKELNMLYHFEGSGYGLVPGKFRTPDPKGYDLVGFKKIYSKWDSIFAEKGWGTIYLGNHDQPRMVTRWGNDAPEYREASSKMLTTFLLTMRGTPYYYFGDELGMTNIKFDRIDQYKDIETLAMYQMTKNNGGDLQDFLEGQKMGARDNGRTPFQWNSDENAGFTVGTPWIKINDNSKTVNVAVEEKDPNSCLNYFRKMVQLRKTNKTLVYGKYTLIDKQNPKIFAYTRGEGDEKILVLLNFSKEDVSWNVINNLKLSDTVLMNNYDDLKKDSKTVSLKAYQAVCLKIK
jgi:oligo-1,6-glucosidase